jgi:hypothetical protein
MRASSSSTRRVTSRAGRWRTADWKKASLSFMSETTPPCAWNVRAEVCCDCRQKSWRHSAEASVRAMILIVFGSSFREESRGNSRAAHSLLSSPFVQAKFRFSTKRVREVQCRFVEDFDERARRASLLRRRVRASRYFFRRLS